MIRLRVQSVDAVFWRCKRQFTKAPTVVEVTEEEAAVLRAEKRLVVRPAGPDDTISEEEAQRKELLASVRAEVKEDVDRALAFARHEGAAEAQRDAREALALARLDASNEAAALRADLAKSHEANEALAKLLVDARERAAKAEADIEALTRPAAPAPAVAPPAEAKPPKK